MLKKLCAGLTILSFIPSAFADSTARQQIFRYAHDGNAAAIRHRLNVPATDTKTNPVPAFVTSAGKERIAKSVPKQIWL